MTCPLLGELPPAHELDAAIRSKTQRSLAYVFRQAAGYLDLTSEAAEAILSNIGRNRQHPGVYARYFELIFAINQNRFGDANRLLAEIAEFSGQPQEFQIVAYERELLGEDFERYPRILFAESPEVGLLVSPTAAESARAHDNMTLALETIRRVDPCIYDEIINLFVHVFVTKDDKEGTGASFGGVTSLMVWGATFANIKAYKERWEAVQFLVHEVTHALLFGLSSDGPLVLNPASENYSSPLRTQLRPMDGIYHATIVCARLTDFNRKWIASGTLAAEDRDNVERETEKMMRGFSDAMSVIDEHGILSPMGRELAERCRGGLAVAA